MQCLIAMVDFNWLNAKADRNGVQEPAPAVRNNSSKKIDTAVRNSGTEKNS